MIKETAMLLDGVELPYPPASTTTGNRASTKTRENRTRPQEVGEALQFIAAMKLLARRKMP